MSVGHSYQHPRPFTSSIPSTIYPSYGHPSPQVLVPMNLSIPRAAHKSRSSPTTTTSPPSDFDYFSQNVLDSSFQRYISPGPTNGLVPGGFHPYRRSTKSRPSPLTKNTVTLTSSSQTSSPSSTKPSSSLGHSPPLQAKGSSVESSSGSSDELSHPPNRRHHSSPSSQSPPTPTPPTRGLSPQFEALRQLRRVSVVPNEVQTPPSPNVESAPAMPSPKPTLLSTDPEPIPMKTGPRRLSKRSLFSKSRMEGKSVDALSLSSTMSSASVMLRKLGNLGSKLPSLKEKSKESLSGISSIFSKSKKKPSKSEISDPSVSYATAEFGCANELSAPADDLTPAARLAKEHLLKEQLETPSSTPNPTATVPVPVEVELTNPIRDPVGHVVEVFSPPSVTLDDLPSILEDIDAVQVYEDALVEAWSALNTTAPPVTPMKGILKHRMTPSNDAARILSQSAPIRDGQNASVVLGHLPTISALNPDQVDGLQRRSSRSSRKSLPTKENIDPTGDKRPSIYLPPIVGKKPKKQLCFAQTLMVYDTFAHDEYDRTSEEGTWKSLTPEIAKEIREELEKYKTEEMILHESYLEG